MLSKIWLLMVGAAVAAGLINGKIEAVGGAALEGASASVELCISLLGPICLWSGVTELLSRSGAAGRLAGALRRPLGALFPGVRGEPAVMEKLGANITANMLGLGNAATPLGVSAAKELGRRCVNGSASRELCNLVIVNTASIQLIPATVASVRAALGSEAPFDILPAVWIASAVSVAVGLSVGGACEALSRRGAKACRLP